MGTVQRVTRTGPGPRRDAAHAPPGHPRRASGRAPAAVGLLAAGVLVLAACGGGASGGGDALAPASASAGTATSTPAPASTTSPSGTELATGFAYQPLWPFRTGEEAAAWQSSGGTTDRWHLDADATALAFTTDYLGFTGVDKVVDSDVQGGEAHVTVGYALPNGHNATAAVVHLARFGAGDAAPWEVAGTDDTTLALSKPAYGATASSPVTAGGMITGVDESLRLAVHQPSSTAPIGSACCTSAGGTDSPWSAPVTFTGATDPVLTLVVSTGGHVADVERFAVTAVRPAG